MVEFLEGGPPDGRRLLPRWAGILGLVAALAVVVAVTIPRPSDKPVTPPPAATATATPTAAAQRRTTSSPDFSCSGRAGSPGPNLTPAPVAALMLETATPGGTVDRWDRTAASGPWAVVVRRHDGSLGRHSAVVTFPDSDPARGRRVPVGRVSGRESPGTVSWPIGGARARVHGELEPGELVAIAAATRMVSGRPVVRAPAGFSVAGSGPYRSPHVREALYETSRLDPELAGLVYTGVAAIGGFEDQLLGRVVSCGSVAGQPAVMSAVGGGNGALAWQLTPGLVAYVGYSGSALSGPPLSALIRLAKHSYPVTARQWRATKPHVIEQRNDPG